MVVFPGKSILRKTIYQKKSQKEVICGPRDNKKTRKTRVVGMGPFRGNWRRPAIERFW